MRALFLIAAAALSACAGPPLRATSAEGAVTQWPAVPPVPLCPWRVCLLAERQMYAGIIEGWLQDAFAGVAVTPDMAGGKNCDVGIRYESLAWGYPSDVLSAYTGERLIHVDANGKDGAKLVCALLLPNQPLGRKLVAQSGRRDLLPPGETIEPEPAPRRAVLQADPAKSPAAEPWWRSK